MSKELKIPTEVYSRVVGYMRPVNQWNTGKQAEFKDRRVHDIKKACSQKENKGSS